MRKPLEEAVAQAARAEAERRARAPLEPMEAPDEAAPVAEVLADTA